jgi:hypothetical protein
VGQPWTPKDYPTRLFTRRPRFNDAGTHILSLFFPSQTLPLIALAGPCADAAACTARLQSGPVEDRAQDQPKSAFETSWSNPQLFQGRQGPAETRPLRFSIESPLRKLEPVLCL